MKARRPPRTRTPSLARFSQDRAGDVAGCDLVARRNDSNLRLGEVLVGKAHRPQHGARSGAGRALGYVLGLNLERHIPIISRSHRARILPEGSESPYSQTEYPLQVADHRARVESNVS